MSSDGLWKEYWESLGMILALFGRVLGILLAVSWGYLIFDEIPDGLSILGMVLIVGSSLFIFIRESIRNKPLAIKTSLRT